MNIYQPILILKDKEGTIVDAILLKICVTKGKQQIIAKVIKENLDLIEKGYEVFFVSNSGTSVVNVLP